MCKGVKELPKWWGLQLVKNFKTKLNRVIITNEIENVPWTTYIKGKNDKEIAEKLFKQITYLHSHKILQNDFELKNILLTYDNLPILIDFEKSILNANKQQIEAEKARVISILNLYSNTKGIGQILSGLFDKKPSKTKTKSKKLNKNKSSKLIHTKKLFR